MTIACARSTDAEGPAGEADLRAGVRKRFGSFSLERPCRVGREVRPRTFGWGARRLIRGVWSRAQSFGGRYIVMAVIRRLRPRHLPSSAASALVICRHPPAPPSSPPSSPAAAFALVIRRRLRPRIRRHHSSPPPTSSPLPPSSPPSLLVASALVSAVITRRCRRPRHPPSSPVAVAALVIRRCRRPRRHLPQNVVDLGGSDGAQDARLRPSRPFRQNLFGPGGGTVACAKPSDAAASGSVCRNASVHSAREAGRRRSPRISACRFLTIGRRPTKQPYGRRRRRWETVDIGRIGAEASEWSVGTRDNPRLPVCARPVRQLYRFAASEAALRAGPVVACNIGRPREEPRPAKRCLWAVTGNASTRSGARPPVLGRASRFVSCVLGVWDSDGDGDGGMSRNSGLDGVCCRRSGRRSELPHIVALDARLATESATNAESRAVESTPGGGGSGGDDGAEKSGRAPGDGVVGGQRSSPTGGGGDEHESRSSVSARTLRTTRVVRKRSTKKKVSRVYVSCGGGGGGGSRVDRTELHRRPPHRVVSLAGQRTGEDRANRYQSVGVAYADHVAHHPERASFDTRPSRRSRQQSAPVRAYAYACGTWLGTRFGAQIDVWTAQPPEGVLGSAVDVSAVDANPTRRTRTLPDGATTASEAALLEARHRTRGPNSPRSSHTPTPTARQMRKSCCKPECREYLDVHSGTRKTPCTSSTHSHLPRRHDRRFCCRRRYLGRCHYLGRCCRIDRHLTRFGIPRHQASRLP